LTQYLRKASPFFASHRIGQLSSESKDNHKPRSTNEVKILGVCGGIGSGKSSACKLLVSELSCLAHIGKFWTSELIDNGRACV
jgi:polynucleotide 5'-kinase involved in rRNA processing